jgi:hypothetical protein
MHAGDEERFSLSATFLLGNFFAGENPFLVRRTGMRFRVQKRRFYRNNVHPFLFGLVEPTFSGSRITGYFAMSWGMRVLQTFWFAVTLPLGLYSAVPGISDYSRECPWLDRLDPWFMFFLGYFIFEAGLYASSNERPEIREWLYGAFADVEISPDQQRQMAIIRRLE